METLQIHPRDPQIRVVRRAVEILRGGGIIAYPTDSCYALACRLDDKEAHERIRRMRALDKNHHFTLVCRDLSELSRYANVTNADYRILRRYTPGPYTFILSATREVPRRLLHPKRRQIGLRIPDHPIPHALLEHLAEPMMSVTAMLPGQTSPLNDPLEIRSSFSGRLNALIDAGPGGIEPTTIIQLQQGEAIIVRQGKGSYP